MKAVWYCENGKAEEVLQYGELPTPVPGSGEVLVRLMTSGVNPSDVRSRQIRPLNAPRIIPHSDGAGIIVAVGQGVDTARIGQRVWIWNGQWERPFGTACEFIAVPEHQAVELPEHISFAQGACLGIPLITAIEAIRQAGDLRGETLLVTGAASSVGHYVSQLALRAGARVIGTIGSTERAASARMAGVTELIDYKTESITERVRSLTGGQGVDAIIDLDFSSVVPLLTDGTLKQHGTAVCYGSNVQGDVALPIRAVFFNSITLKFFVAYNLTPTDRAFGLHRLSQLLQDTTLIHQIGAEFPLQDTCKAHQAVETGKVVGNVVIHTVDAPAMSNN